jgi:hypothetical protein
VGKVRAEMACDKRVTAFHQKMAEMSMENQIPNLILNSSQM